MKTMLEQLEESVQRNPDSRVTIIRDNRKMVMKLDDFLVEIDVSAYPGRTPSVSLDQFGPWLHRQMMNIAELYKQHGRSMRYSFVDPLPKLRESGRRYPARARAVIALAAK